MVKVLLFGSIADTIGLREVTVNSNSISLKDVIENIERVYRKVITKPYILSVNCEVVSSDFVVTESDEVAIMPPFAGG